MIAASRACFVTARNEKARFRIRPLRAALTTSREVHSEVLRFGEQLRLQTAMALSVQKQKGSYNAQQITRSHAMQRWHMPSLQPTPRESRRAAAATI
jgi:hypothetical protein